MGILGGVTSRKDYPKDQKEQAALDRKEVPEIIVRIPVLIQLNKEILKDTQVRVVKTPGVLLCTSCERFGPGAGRILLQTGLRAAGWGRAIDSGSRGVLELGGDRLWFRQGN